MIRLRRPVALSVMDGLYVPDSTKIKHGEIDRRWTKLRESNPAYFDGRVWHVLGAHRNGYGGAVLHVIDCAYRFYAVQTDQFDLGVRPLGVKAIVARGGKVLLGRRSRTVAAYPDMWEFVPGGAVEPGCDPAQAILQELAEETSVKTRSEPIPIAVAYDATARTWEIIFRLTASDIAEPTTSCEHTELKWSAIDEARMMTGMTPIARCMLPLADGP